MSSSCFKNTILLKKHCDLGTS